MLTTKYIHVVRNGLDTAYSTNQYQNRLRGKAFLGRSFEPTPSYSLSFCCAVHKIIISLKQKFPENIHLLSYDQLWTDPNAVIRNLLVFCKINCEKDLFKKLSKMINAPYTIGRFREFGLIILIQKTYNSCK